MLVIVAVATGALLILSWLQNRNVAALAWWGVSNLVGAVGIALLGLRNVAPDIMSIDAANIILHLTFAINWVGTRRFGGRGASFAAVVAPSIIWFLLCRIDAFYASILLRGATSSAIMAGYALASAWELSRLRSERLVSRYPAMIWLLFHAVWLVARMGLLFIDPAIGRQSFISSPLFAIGVLEALLNVIALSFLQIAMVRERAENQHREAALTDLLTCVPNRRALFLEGARLLGKARAGGQSLCALLIDIDHFKAVNDRFGHDGGDAVLIGVANTMRAHLRGEDFFARLGGEEFVCLLPNTSMSAAVMVAEGLRARVASMKLINADAELRVSISIGVACASGASIDTLLSEADRNLYDAKSAGRNRISATPDPTKTPRLRVA